MKKILLTVLVLAVALFAAEKVYLAPVGLTGMHEDYAVASSKLMKAYIEDDGRYILVVGTAEDGVKADNQAAVSQKAAEKGCSKYIIAEFTRLGENVIMSFKLYNVGSEAPIWDDRLKARNPDDFDPIIQRVARNIGTKHKAVDDSDIYSVTEQETKTPKRKGVNAYIGMSVGGLMAVQPEVEVFAGLDFWLLYDAQVILFGIDWDMYGLGDDTPLDYMDFAISAYYPFGTRAITPFVGGGLAFSQTEYESKVPRADRYTDSDVYSYSYSSDDYEYNDKSSGLTGFVGGGVMFNRSSRVTFVAQVKYMLNFYKNDIYKSKKDEKNNTIISVKDHAIQGMIFNVGIGYGF